MSSHQLRPPPRQLGLTREQVLVSSPRDLVTLIWAEMVSVSWRSVVCVLAVVVLVRVV